MIIDTSLNQKTDCLTIKDINPDVTQELRASESEDVFVDLCGIIYYNGFSEGCSTHSKILNSFPKDTALRKEWLDKICDLIDNTIMPPQCFCSKKLIYL